MKKLIATLSILLATSSFAGGPYRWGAELSEVKPGHYVDILVPKGFHDIGMQLTCDVEVPNYNKEYPPAILISDNASRTQTLGAPNVTIYFTHNHAAHPTADFFPVSIKNLDKQDTIFVKNCMSFFR